VSACLVGRSSHVKLSVRSIARSILRCRNLRQRNETFISSLLNVEKHSKDSRNLRNSWYEIMRIEIPSSEDSENKILCVLSGVDAINVSVLCVSMLPTGEMFCHCYQNLTFDQYTCSIPEGRCLCGKANYFQTMLG
jgi:hypothetical protein